MKTDISLAATAKATDATSRDQTRSGINGQGDPDGRLFAVAQQYAAEIQAGRHPSLTEWKTRYPEIADDLSACLQGMAFVDSAVGRLSDSVAARLDDHGVDAAADLASGQPLGDFRLICELGRGGMGVVYEAEQLSLGRRVALKVLPLAASLDPRHLQRFRNEAQAAAHLHHTNIVPVYAVGCERGVHFYAMQLIIGQSLAAVIGELQNRGSRPDADAGGSSVIPGLANTPDSIHSLTGARLAKREEFYRAVARLGLQAAEALEYAHQQGVVHRDIKPANLLLDARGNLWVTDFGLAQMYSGDNGLTQPGDLLGTLRYMSPEQTSGRAVVLDHRTDVFSLGVTLYEVLTLERAFAGETREAVLYEVGHMDARPVRSIDRAVPCELETILAKAMSKAPDERYQKAADLADDLRRFLQDEPIRARPPTVWDKAVKWTRRHRTVAVAAVAVLLIAALGLAVSTVMIAREQSRTAAALRRERQSAAEAHRLVGAFSRFAAADVPKDPRFVRVRRRMLETAIACNRSYIDSHRDDPLAAGERAEAEHWASAACAELQMLDEVVRVKYASSLLLQPAIAQELHLSAAQADSLKQLATAFLKTSPGGRMDVRNLTQDQRRDLALLGATQHMAAVGQILSPTQLQRLLEISRQIRGLYAFSDPDVVAGLSLTPVQQERIRSEEEAFVDAELAATAEFPPDAEALQKKKAVDVVLESLTPAQREAWRAMTGDAYSGPVPHFSQGVWRLE